MIYQPYDVSQQRGHAKLNQWLLIVMLHVFVVPSARALSCFETSPFVASGGKLSYIHNVPRITDKQTADVKSVLSAVKGKWKGSRIITQCTGRKGAANNKISSQALLAEARFDGKNFHLELRKDHNKKSKKDIEVIDYILKDRHLKVETRDRSGPVQVLKTNPKGISFYVRTPNTSDTKASTITEIANVVEIIKQKVIFKEFVYQNGELNTQSIMTLQAR